VVVLEIYGMAQFLAKRLRLADGLAWVSLAHVDHHKAHFVAIGCMQLS
jgi:hypothetical protein